MKKNKIGLLTFHDTTNFGAILQAVATYKAIKKLGYEVEIINYHNEFIDEREIPEIHNKKVSKSIKFWFKFLLRDYKQVRKHKSLLNFLNHECLVSNKYYAKDNIKTTKKQYDTFVVGSDMLWCLKYTKSDFSYMLDFVENSVKKLAFATSIGFEWNDSEKAQIKPLLENFNDIALREEDSCIIVSKMLNRQIPWVCDPTMLVEPKEWIKYTRNTNCKEYALIYMDDAHNNCLNAAKEYSKNNDIDVRLLSFRFNFDIRKKSYKYIEAYTIEEFLTLIKNAEFLFTSSFHGMLFAIYFHVPFVFFNKDSSRLISLAKKLDLEKRNGNIYDFKNMQPINWEEVDKKREEFRINSLNILKGMLADNE